MTGRWKRRARSELGQVQDLLRVLFQPRNGKPWTPDERAFLQRELRALARRWAPGFFLFLLPGGLLLAPLYAALLDQRRNPAARSGEAGPAGAAPATALEGATASVERLP